MKIAICVPSKDTVHAGFSICLALLTAKLTRDKIPFEVKFNLGTVIANQRNELVDAAITSGATHILWLDTDMHFPSTVVNTLLSHNKPIVAATYSTRYKPQRSVAFVDQDNIDLRLQKNTGLHQVWAVALGCMLIETKVYKDMPKPWFQYVWNEDTQDLSGEDIYFCNCLQDYDYEVFVDADLSNQIAHLGTKAFLINETDEFS